MVCSACTTWTSVGPSQAAQAGSSAAARGKLFLQLHIEREHQPERFLHNVECGAEARVFGRVLLWGATVEGTHGWRAACARPVEIFVPSAVIEPVEGLEAYGVPVHVLERLEAAVPA